MKASLHLMTCMKRSSILKHILSMKHKRRQISPTCPLLPISHKNHFIIHLEAKCQTVHPIYLLPTKIVHHFPQTRPLHQLTNQIFSPHNILPTLASVYSVTRSLCKMWERERGSEREKRDVCVCVHEREKEFSYTNHKKNTQNHSQINYTLVLDLFCILVLKLLLLLLLFKDLFVLMIFLQLSFVGLAVFNLPSQQ